MSNPFTTPIADALRAAAFDCDGTGGQHNAERCEEQHPIQAACIHHGVVSDLYGPIDAIADVAAATARQLVGEALQPLTEHLSAHWQSLQLDQLATNSPPTSRRPTVAEPTREELALEHVIAFALHEGRLADTEADVLRHGIRRLAQAGRSLTAALWATRRREQAANAATQQLRADLAQELHRYQAAWQSARSRATAYRDGLLQQARETARQRKRAARAEAELAQLHTAVRRADTTLHRLIANARECGETPLIHASQVLALLSPTWPDGNYEAAQPDVTVTVHPDPPHVADAVREIRRRG